MALFTDMAINFNNLIRVAEKPLKVVCLAVKRVFSRTKSRGLFTLQWQYPASGARPTPFPPQEIISCSLKEVVVKECRLHPLAFRRLVVVGVTYRVKVQVVYLDLEGNMGVATLHEEVRRYSRPLPGSPLMSAVAGVALDLADCHLERRGSKRLQKDGASGVQRVSRRLD